MSEQKEYIEEISWDEATTVGSKYLKFEPGVRTKLKLKNWKVVKKSVPNFDDKEVMEEKPAFIADVIEQDGKPVEFSLEQLSKRFMQAIRPFVEGKNPEEPVLVSIKRIGEGNGTNYDIE